MIPKIAFLGLLISQSGLAWAQPVEPKHKLERPDRLEAPDHRAWPEQMDSSDGAGHRRNGASSSALAPYKKMQATIRDKNQAGASPQGGSKGKSKKSPGSIAGVPAQWDEAAPVPDERDVETVTLTNPRTPLALPPVSPRATPALIAARDAYTASQIQSAVEAHSAYSELYYDPNATYKEKFEALQKWKAAERAAADPPPF